MRRKPPGRVPPDMEWQRPDPDELTIEEIMGFIRARCPWAAGHTHTSLEKYLLEETHELIAALHGHAAHPSEATRAELVGELGDVLYQVLFHAAILDSDDAGPAGRSADRTPGTAPELRAEPHPPVAMAEVVSGLAAKLVRRHPHVFDSDGPVDIVEVERRYEEVKAAERADSRTADRAGRARASFASVPVTLPALTRAHSVLGRMDRLELAVPAVPERAPGAAASAEERAIGRELFAIARRAHAAGIDAEAALRSITSEVEEAAIRSSAQGPGGGERR